MPTIKQKNLAKEIIANSVRAKPLNKGQLLAKVSYSAGLQKQPTRVIEAVGVQDALRELGFNEESAKQVVQEIMLNDKVDPNARLKATDQVFKVTGAYAPEKKEETVRIFDVSKILDKAYGPDSTA